MTPLEKLLIRQISATGPITVAEYMAACLLHPRQGNYAAGQPLGAEGDFITAPEISQMFGELLGLWVAQTWIDQGRPTPFALAELGPGRGTLMADVFRALSTVPGAAEAADVRLVEASPTLRSTQAETLAGLGATWHESVAALPEDRPLFLLANEFFDTLPVRQYLRDGDAWRERQVGVRGRNLVFGLSDPLPTSAIDRRLEDIADGAMVETRPAESPIVEEIARRTRGAGGAALMVDYGGRRIVGDTLQAVRGHAKVPPLTSPGLADLTAHVDFDTLARAADGATIYGPVPQGEFLERLGIAERARALSTGLRGFALQEHVAAHRRLTHPEEMGNLFQVMALTSPNAPPPPGFGQ